MDAWAGASQIIPDKSHCLCSSSPPGWELSADSRRLIEEIKVHQLDEVSSNCLKKSGGMRTMCGVNVLQIIRIFIYF